MDDIKARTALQEAIEYGQQLEEEITAFEESSRTVLIA